MIFEKCLFLDDPNVWFIIPNDQLVKEVTNEEIDRMIILVATVRHGMAKYRRYIPDYVKDWAKPGTTYA